jgi:pyridoxamine 5'-phosphate oxidase
MTQKILADIRIDYSKRELSQKKVDADPFVEFGIWMDEALTSEVPEPTAMTLATVAPDGRPSSRVVLLKGFDSDGFVFFTNYKSRKGRQLAENPHAAINFFWPELERQVNVSGRTSKVSVEESDEYFQSRPYTSRIGAWASHQSERIESKSAVMATAAKLMLQYPLGHVPRPPHWGGFRLVPDRFEFWQGRPSRLHDRICYELSGDAWEISRLSP